METRHQKYLRRHRLQRSDIIWSCICGSHTYSHAFVTEALNEDLDICEKCGTGPCCRSMAEVLSPLTLPQYNSLMSQLAMFWGFERVDKVLLRYFTYSDQQWEDYRKSLEVQWPLRTADS